MDWLLNVVLVLCLQEVATDLFGCCHPSFHLLDDKLSYQNCQMVIVPISQNIGHLADHLKQHQKVNCGVLCLPASTNHASGSCPWIWRIPAETRRIQFQTQGALRFESRIWFEDQNNVPPNAYSLEVIEIIVTGQIYQYLFQWFV